MGKFWFVVVRSFIGDFCDDGWSWFCRRMELNCPTWNFIKNAIITSKGVIMNHTIFDDIVSGRMKSWKIWEDGRILAFLTPFPGTPGCFTVRWFEAESGDYVFSLDDNLYSEMMLAVKKVAGILEKAFDTPQWRWFLKGGRNTCTRQRIVPLHGDLASQTLQYWSKETEFSEVYRGCALCRRSKRMMLNWMKFRREF